MVSISTALLTAVSLHFLTCCFAQLGKNFLMYDKNMNKCLRGYQPLKLFHCDSNQLSQQFRWTSEDRIFNVHLKKCLGAGSRADGSGLQWFTCDDKSDLQKWECKNNTKLNLKGTDLFVSQEENTVLRLTQDNSTASHWLIHGTEEGLCSRPYQELYTLGGNSFGRPCNFPFQHEGKWYSDCAPRKSTNRTFCLTGGDRWGFCPTTSTEGWKKNPLTGVYYQVNVNSALTWHQARMSCQQQDSDLLSITEPQEQTFISGITSEFTTVFWIGLNRLNNEAGWQWTNGRPFRYLRWGSGQPNREHGWSCGSLSTLENFSWYNKLCSKKHGYICQKRSSAPTIPPSLPVACNAPWIPYEGHCYFLNRTKYTWKDASDQCIAGGGNLASIHNIEEQSFVFSQLGYRETDKLWIGLNDKKTQLLFEWSDHSRVMFTAWDVQEPSHHRSEEEDCVLMGGKDGNWADDICSRKYGFVCKKAGNSKFASDSDDQSPGCKVGWVRHGYYCYFVGSETRTFEEAEEICKKSDAHLVDVQHRVDNAFLISLVGPRPEKHFWIGLNNQRDRFVFEWTNTQKVPYTHWNTHMPGQRQGCVGMTTGSLGGLWDVLSCSNKEKYICRHQAEGVVTTPAPPTSPAPSCAEGWRPLGIRPFCYKFYDMDYDERKTWFEALDYCRSIGGDLISITSHLDNIKTDSGWNGWIGYSAQDPNAGYTWSDGTSSAYTNWNEGEPDNKHNDESCVTIDISNTLWQNRACEYRSDFICEIRKEYNVSRDGWIEYNGHQYLISFYDTDYMDTAQKHCRTIGGYLVIINDRAENRFIRGQISSSWNHFYIGMGIDFESNIRWMDGTPVTYQNWAEEEPPSEIIDQTCVIMDYSYGLWSTTNCGKRWPYICERDGEPPVNSTRPPPPVPVGGCAPEWTQYNEHCYKIESSPKRFKEAQVYCRKGGGNLASIVSTEEQAFFTVLMSDVRGDVWIGMKSTDSEVFWTDGRGVAVTNFNRLKRPYPVLYPSWNGIDEEVVCYKMLQSPALVTGQWRPSNCNETLGFICKRPVDTRIPPQKTGLTLSYKSFGNYSLKVLENNLTWWDAKKACEKDNGHLVSIRDAVAQGFVELQAHQLKQPVWIGLNTNETNGYFQWIDGWNLNYVNWQRNEPKTHYTCVYVDGEGGWKTAQCNQSLPSVCKKSAEVPPTPDTRYPGVCPETESDITWLPFKGHCYMVTYDEENFARAFMTCSRRGASLLSIEDPEEAEFIKEIAIMLQDTYQAIWLGLCKTLRGQWGWLDKTVLDFTNWADDEPSDYDQHAVLSTEDFKWRSGGSYMYKPYICKTPKVPSPVAATASPSTSQGARRNVAMAVIVIVVAVVALVGGAAFVYQKRYTPSLPSAPTFENPMYFKVAREVVPDNKCLLNDTEAEEN
ncbi:macrophage mannose receptor 1b isoform X2 [Engraulis encrasicolus]|uniref:macrophage mannose receptor 1b isoform X2 n=1 Tax=Engraulis encrasicolus TaxID=184585 RepID=UPI002FD66048